MAAPISYWEEVKRKAVHLSSLWMVAITILLPRTDLLYPRLLLCGIFALCLAITLISEHDFANNGPYLGRLYGKLFGKMLRSEVYPGQWIVSGGAPVLAAALLVNILFPPQVAAAAMAVMLTGDAAAALIGRRFGKHKLCNGKSWEGTISFAVVSAAAVTGVLLLDNAAPAMYLAVVPAVIVAALVELFTTQIRIDDNFTIPLAAGTLLMLAYAS